MKFSINILKLLVIYLTVTTLLSACSITRQANHNEGPPILTLDELIRPYAKVGRIQVTREIYGSDYSLSPDITAWGLAAVRHEAEKMGADAVILPEITGHSTTNGIIPSTEYHVTGIAIKFK